MFGTGLGYTLAMVGATWLNFDTVAGVYAGAFFLVGGAAGIIIDRQFRREVLPVAKSPRGDTKVSVSETGRAEGVAMAMPIDKPTADQVVRAIEKVHASTELLLHLVMKDAAGLTMCVICHGEIVEFDPEPHSCDDEGNVCPVEILLAGIEGFTAHDQEARA